jgi:hypothetical protein
MNTDAIANLFDQLTKVMQEIELLKNPVGIREIVEIHKMTLFVDQNSISGFIITSTDQAAVGRCM